MSKRADANTTHATAHPIFIPHPTGGISLIDFGLARLEGASKLFEALASTIPNNLGPTHLDALQSLSMDICSLYEHINEAITAMDAALDGGPKVNGSACGANQDGT